MRPTAYALTAMIVLLGLTCDCQAGGDETTAIIDKAIKAHGIKGKQDKSTAYRGKNKGTLHVAGMDLEFTQEVAMQGPDKFKEVMELTVMNNKVTVTTVFDGKQGWIKAGDKDIKVEKELLNECKEAAHAIQLTQAMFFKDKALKLALVGEVMVKGKPAVGIKVSKKGMKDIDFYFDKSTGLLAKVERRTLDFMSGQEVTEERIITEYQEVDGRKIAKKVEILRDGKAFLEAEVMEAQLLERIDDNQFGKPD